MDIRAVLESVEHNRHYLNKYIRFLAGCQTKNSTAVRLEKHHICPKAADMFPQYRNLRTHTWNVVKLTSRQHIIAHYMLMKAYPDKSSQRYALWAMNNESVSKINSRLFETVRSAFVETVSDRHKGKIVSIETKKKLSEYRKGKTYEEIMGVDAAAAVKVKQSETRKGKYTGSDNPMFGKSPSAERRAKSSNPGSKNGMFGRKHSPEALQKMRVSKRLRDSAKSQSV